MNTNARGALFALAGFAAFATHDAIIKSLGQSYSVFQILFFVVLFGFPLTTVLLIRDSQPGTLWPRYPGWVFLRTGLAIVTGFSAFYAFTALPLAEVYAILFAQPLLITAFAVPFLGEKVGPRRAVAVLVGLVGVIVVLQPGSIELTPGHAAALFAATAGSFVSLILRKIGGEERSVVLIVYPLMGNFVAMAAILPFVYVPMPVADLGLFAAVALLSFVGMLLMIGGYRAASAGTIAPMQYSQIIWAALFGALFFDEVPSVSTAIGVAIIIASGVYIVAREERGTTSLRRPVTSSRTIRGDTAAAPRAGDFIRLDAETAAKDSAEHGQTPLRSPDE
ncbi:MAG: DMT family transporter [Rubricella sp.]